MICMLTLPDQSNIASYIHTKLEGSGGMPPEKFENWCSEPGDCILGHFQSNTDKVDKLYTNSYIATCINFNIAQ